MLPLRSAVNWPLWLTALRVVVLFDADGFLPPPFTHSYVVVANADPVTVSTDPLWSPASLKLNWRLEPESCTDVALLMKCALPATAVAAPIATMASDAS